MSQQKEVKTELYCTCSMHLVMIWVVGVAAAMVYYCRVGHGWSMEWDGDGTYIMQCNTVHSIVQAYFSVTRFTGNIYQYIREGFPQLAPGDPYSGGHCFHPYGRHDRAMVWMILDGRCGATGWFLYYSYICKVRTTSFEKAGENLPTR